MLQFQSFAVADYERRVKEVCSRIIEVIGEIDALGGEYYVPPSLFSTLGMPRANYIVEKGSLSFLCGPEEYVPEEVCTSFLNYHSLFVIYYY